MLDTTIQITDEMLEDVSGRQVFEILAAENADMLVCYLRTLVRGTDVVDDLFQETMITAWYKLPAFDRNRPFGPRLRRIAANKVRQHRERSSRNILRCDGALDGFRGVFNWRTLLRDRRVEAGSARLSAPSLDRAAGERSLGKLPS